MSNTCRASIVINNYNYGRFLADAIESALAQSHKDIEVIVVDDGSTDDSRQVMSRYADRITAVCKANGGQASAYNAGFAASRGDIVCFLDADDTLNETAIAEAAAAFEDSHLVNVEWQLQIVDGLGEATGKFVPEKRLPDGNLRELSILIGPLYDWWFTPPSSGNCYSRRFLQETMPVPEPPFCHGADVYLTILAPIYGEVHRLAEPQGTYRIHGKNNYFGRALDSNRLRDYVQRFENCCEQLQKHFAAMGVEVDVETWKQRNFNYLWPTRLLQAKSDLKAVVPAGGSYALIDGNEWADTEPIEDRHVISFTTNAEEDKGPPVDDEAAIAQLESHRRRGVKYLIFWWTCFWWLDHYQAFKRHLYSRFPCVLQNDRLIVFEITKGAPVVALT
jgi:glycosyltransferase involved in cell wall biosynthesis